MKKKTKKMIVKVVKRSARILICGLLIMTQILPVYASISASDGIGAVTKPEFNSVVADFNSRISKLEMGTNAKIEATVNEYLSKIDIGGGVGAKGYVINDETEITGTKDATTGAYSNVTAITGIEIADLKIGDNIYVRDNTASNYYVSQISPTVSMNVISKKIDLSNYQQDIITNISGSAGEVLARNSTNNGLEFIEHITKQDIFNIIRPIHSTFIQYGANDNPNTLFNTTGITSTWTKVDITEGYIQLDKTKTAGTAVSEELPNIKGSFESMKGQDVPIVRNTTGGFKWETNTGTSIQSWGISLETAIRVATVHTFNASTGQTSNSTGTTYKTQAQSTYKDNGKVHPKGQTAILWERTA